MKAQVTKKEEPKKTPKEELMEVVKKMVESTYIDQPEDVALYFLNWLKKEKGFMTSGLSLDQDDELSKLRLQMVRYKDLDENNKANQPPKEEDYISDEDPNDIDEELIRYTNYLRNGIRIYRIGKTIYNKYVAEKLMPKAYRVVHSDDDFDKKDEVKYIEAEKGKFV